MDCRYRLIRFRKSKLTAISVKVQEFGLADAQLYAIHVQSRPRLAEKMATVVVQPSIFSQRLFTCSPMILRLLVISMMRRSKGGVENPCTIPDHTSAFMGLKPKKLRPMAMNVNADMAR